MPDLRRLLPFPIEELGRYPVEARHHPPTAIAYTTGKNASHITLVIDAMDLLHSGQFDGLCLVSSDSDFTRLAARIREQGVDVFGFGEHKTPESFRQACRTFVYTENLLAGAAGNLDPVSPSRPLLPAGAATLVIEKVLTQMESEDGWVTLREVGTQLANLASDFDPRTYGFRKLSDLVRKTNAFDIEQLKGGAHSHEVLREAICKIEGPHQGCDLKREGGRRR